MEWRKGLIKIAPCLWEIPQSHNPSMRVPARLCASEQMLDQIFKDRSVQQIVNVATLPGVVGHVMIMPDAHEGYGFPIGGVAAMRLPDGVISPGGIGYDINCGVRLLRSSLTEKEIRPYLEQLSQQMYRQVPSGVGRGGNITLSAQEFDDILTHGLGWMLKREYAFLHDIPHIESQGRLLNADSHAVSQTAKDRGKNQLGTLGAGNHFVEIDYVDKIYDQAAAHALGLRVNQLVVLIHTGSRGLGHQVATDYLREMVHVMPKYGITLPDRELAAVPFSSKEGIRYFNAMAAAANFAWANRQAITWEVRNAWKKVLGETGGNLEVVYDVAHNIAKKETHRIDGQEIEVIMHRKGATRAFGPGHPELAPEYRNLGQPVIIPGSMGTASYVLAGTPQGMNVSFGSSCHGAGRVLSRQAAKKMLNGKAIQQTLLKRGIVVQTDSLAGLAEEAPEAYKDIDEVIEIVHQTGIAHKVARLIPCAVIKG